MSVNMCGSVYICMYQCDSVHGCMSVMCEYVRTRGWVLPSTPGHISRSFESTNTSELMIGWKTLRVIYSDFYSSLLETEINTEKHWCTNTLFVLVYKYIKLQNSPAENSTKVRWVKANEKNELTKWEGTVGRSRDVNLRMFCTPRSMFPPSPNSCIKLLYHNVTAFWRRRFFSPLLER